MVVENENVLSHGLYGVVCMYAVCMPYVCCMCVLDLWVSYLQILHPLLQKRMQLAVKLLIHGICIL